MISFISLDKIMVIKNNTAVVDELEVGGGCEYNRIIGVF